MTQFIAPSLQFLVGYFLYNEAVSISSWVSFSLIWAGAGLYLSYQFRQLIKAGKKSKSSL